MLSHKEYVNLLQDNITKYHQEETLPGDVPEAQHESLLPTLRPYQVRAVNWMLARELYADDMNKGYEVQIPSGGILADEMGLGKTVEVLSCILVNPRKSFSVDSENENTFGTHKTLSLPVAVEPVESSTSLEVSRNIVEHSEKLPEKSNRKRVHFNTDCEDIPVKKFKYENNSIETNVVNMEEEDTIAKTIEEVIEQYCDTSAKKSSSNRSGVRAMLQSWYEYKLSETSPSFRRRKPANFYNETEIKCCCIGDITSDETVLCPMCNTYQHECCVGYDQLDPGEEYFCFNCWKEQPPIQSGATVIISPESICNQWIAEIDKHIKKDGMNVLMYSGVRVNGYIQPPVLAKYDLVITTYEALRKEIYFAEAPSEGRQLRQAKRYFAPSSPLTCVQWWRLCLDEAQIVESITSKTAEMAKKFHVIHKWAVTGTPIQKSVLHDLHGLVEFLAISPYNNFKEWQALVNDSERFLQFLPRILWRTAKKDVMQELGVPEQKVIPHWLEFSPVEMYFYQTQHNECSALFVQKIARIKNLNVTLNNLDRRLVSAIMLPLLRIRQACSHPQAVKGQFLSVKKTMTMEDLLLTMVDKTKLECEEILREIVAALNGIAGLQIIQHKYFDAVNSYREVLHLVQEYKDKLKVDSLQKIHTMHNLAEVLEGHPGIVAPTLRDGQLRIDAVELEKKYLDKRESSAKSIKEPLEKCSKEIGKISEGRTLGYSEWWLKVLENTYDHDELLDKLKTVLERTDILHQHQQFNLAKKLHSLVAVRNELAKWLADTDSCRQNVLKLMRNLDSTSREDMAAIALLCHLPGSSAKISSKCDLCKCETALKQYEALIFEERVKSNRKQTQKSNSRLSDSFKQAQKNKNLADLVNLNVHTFEFSKKGGLKASQHEKVLNELKSYCRSKHMPSELSSDATKHLRLLSLVKKEFLFLNNYWTQISEQVLATDELNMAKLRLRLPMSEEEEEEEENLFRNKKGGVETKYIIKSYKVPEELHSLENVKVHAEHKFKAKLGTLYYLQNLQKGGDSSNTTCPICRNSFTDQWSVLHCGHCICLECLPVMLKQSRSSISCVQCRQQCSVKEISYVSKSDSSYVEKTQNIKGSFSTKIEAVITTVLNLMKTDPSVKVLVFSSWEKVLDVIAEGFGMNEINYRRLVAGKKTHISLKDFKTKSVTALLLSLRYGSKGLNLVEATHVFLVEPILNPSDELQAIGRVHRIGQTRETFVHRYIVKNTIEERIVQAMDSSGIEEWNKEITLQQLYDLFHENKNAFENLGNENTVNDKMATGTQSSGEPSTSQSIQGSDSSDADEYESANEEKSVFDSDDEL